ncbi:hypothetical protein SBRCBS47491_008792 [Sporothrix bragantina]|uniref:Uncharacterized protein n=1 Tax=Sporothrix bragantina TaxID=671064 RepID=A0ABP0CSB1_9PEZI
MTVILGEDDDDHNLDQDGDRRTVALLSVHGSVTYHQEPSPGYPDPVGHMHNSLPSISTGLNSQTAQYTDSLIPRAKVTPVDLPGPLLDGVSDANGLKLEADIFNGSVLHIKESHNICPRTSQT